MSSSDSLQRNASLSAAERRALYRVIFSRRDVRGQFIDTPVDEAVLSRILYAAHHAPSVGFMQPWNFILVKSRAVRQRVHAAFTKAHAEAAEMFSEEKRQTYRNLKLEGILDCPLNICVTCDTSRSGPVVIGRTHISTMDTYSSVCAIQNLWLAARAEGLGVGWVSILDEEQLSEILQLPEAVVPVGYLCLGHVRHFLEKPELENAGWLPRLDLRELVAFERWGGAPGEGDAALLKQLRADAEFPRRTQRPDPEG